MGYSSGFCLKKVSRILAFGLGGLFIVVQSLSYNGYIKVNYDGIQKEIEVHNIFYILYLCYDIFMSNLCYYFSFILIQNILDINKDGKVDNKDLQHGLDKVRDVLEYNMPSGGGFTAGLMLGLRG